MFNVPTWHHLDSGDALERATYGDLSIEADGVCLTEVLDTLTHSSRRTIRVALAPLAHWLLWNHWRLRYEPERHEPSWALSHSLQGIGDGYLWPAVSLWGDGETVRLRACPSPPTNTHNPPMVRFLTAHQTRLDPGTFDRAVDRLVQLVLGRASAIPGADASALASLAETVRAEVADPELANLRRHEALLGLDPDEQPVEALAALQRSTAWLGVAATDELFASSTFHELHAVNAQLQFDHAAPNLHLNISDVRQAVAAPLPPVSEPPWKRGRQLARRLRTALGLGLRPLDLDALVHARLSDVRSPKRPRLAGFHHDHRISTAVGGHPTTVRFAVARLVGDALTLPPGEHVSPVVESERARQQLQRAFAQELLAPIDGIRERVRGPNPDDEDIEEAARYYDVSPLTVTSALVNHGHADRSLLQDGLR